MTHHLLKPFFAFWSRSHLMIFMKPWGLFFARWSMCNIYLCVCVCSEIVLLQQMSWETNTFHISMGSLGFFLSVHRYHLATFVFVFGGLYQWADGRRKRGQLWSRICFECWLGHVALLEDSGHITEPFHLLVFRKEIIISIYRLAMGSKRKRRVCGTWHRGGA